jgi:sugar phosphate permease
MQFIVWADEVAFASLVPFWSEHYGFDAVQIATITSAYLLGYFPMLFIAGILADIIGPRKCMLIAVVGCGITSALILLCDDYDSMYIRNLIFGVVFGFSWSPATKMMSQWLPGKERAQRVAVWSLFTSIASVVMSPVSLMVASRVDWHYVFIIVALGAIPVIIMIWKSKDLPSQFKGISEEEKNYIMSGIGEYDEGDKITFKKVGQVLKDPNCWIILFAASFATCPTWAMNPWATTIYMNVYGLSADFVGITNGLMALIPVAFSFTTGFWLIKVFKGNIKMLLITAPFIGGVAYLLCGLVPMTGIVAMILVNFAQSTNAFGWGGSGAYWAGYTKPELWGTLNGLTAMIQVALGYTIVSLSGSWVTEGATVGGYGRIFIYAGAIWFMATILGIFGKKVHTSDNWETVRARYKK